MELTFDEVTMRRLIDRDHFLTFAYKALKESTFRGETDIDMLKTLFKYHVIGDSKLSNAYRDLSK